MIHTLAIEKIDGRLMLVAQESVDHVILLAEFVNAEAAETYKRAVVQMVCAARESGRSGI
jgi:hypothetical protein